MHSSKDTDAKILHEIMQPLNVIRLSCGNIRVKMSSYSSADAQYLIQKIVRIEEQVMRATQLLQDLKTRNDDHQATNDD